MAKWALLAALHILVLSVVSTPSNASDIHFSCRIPGSTILSVAKINTARAELVAKMLRSDIVEACQDGWALQGTAPPKQCIQQLANWHHEATLDRVTANCRTDQVNLNGRRLTFPVNTSCAAGGFAAYEAFRLLCPRKRLSKRQLDGYEPGSHGGRIGFATYQRLKQLNGYIPPSQCRDPECIATWHQRHRGLFRWLAGNADGVRPEHIVGKLPLADNTMLVSYDNSHTHVRVVRVSRDGTAKPIGDGDIELISERPLSYRLSAQKSYRKGGGAFWYDTVRNADNQIVQIALREGLSDGACLTRQQFLDLTHFTRSDLAMVPTQRICPVTRPSVRRAAAPVEKPAERSTLVSTEGNWKIYRVSGGAFYGCRMSKRVKSGLFLVVEANGNELFRVGLVAPQRNWQPGERLRGWLRFDTGPRERPGVQAVNEKLAMFTQLGEEEGFEGALRRAHVLTMEVDGLRLISSLKGSSRATDKLWRCVSAG